MSLRLVISLVCVAAVAFACGPRTRSESATQSAAVTIASTPSTEVAQQSDERVTTTRKGALSATLYVRGNETPMRLALHVVNTSKKRLELTFPSGQTHDFVILDSVGREVWRWGKGRMFTQSLRNKLLGGGESLELEESVGLVHLNPGRYTARAILTSVNHPITEESEFTVQMGVLASRE